MPRPQSSQRCRAPRSASLNLLFAPCRFELCHQVRRTHDVLSQSTQQIDGAAIDQGNREDDIVRRILHRDVAIGRQDRLQFVEQLLPAGILVFACREGNRDGRPRSCAQALPVRLRPGSNKTSAESPSGQQAIPARDRRWDRDDGDRRTATHQCCVRAAQIEWQPGPWANIYCKQEAGFGRIAAPLGSDAVCPLHDGCHPERSRFSGVAKDLPLSRRNA